MGIKSFLTSMSLKLKITVACAAVAVAGVITAVVLANVSTDNTYRVLKVFELSGSAVVSRQGAGDIAAYVGMNLESGDTLSVNGGSTLRISLDGDKYVLLDEGTVLELVAEGTPSDSRTSINLIEGTILNELTTALSANSSYEVATPKATMAVRGTSFMVSVEKNEDGSYTIRTNTFHGKVEAMLLDANGKPTGKSALITAGKCVIIRTEPNPSTGNPAEVDGKSFFVYEIEPGVFIEVPEGSSPVTDIVYELISEIIKEYALKSNDSGLMQLDEYIVKMLRGIVDDIPAPATSAEETKPETTVAVSETDVSESRDETTTTTTVPETTYISETTVTTVPTSETTESTTVTTVPTSKTTKRTTVTTVPTSKTTKRTTVTTVPTSKTTKRTTVTTVPTSVITANTTVTTVPTSVITANTTATTVPTSEITSGTSETTVPTSETSESTTVPTESTTDISTTPETERFMVTFVYNGETVDEIDVDKGETVGSLPDLGLGDGYEVKWVYGDDGTEFNTNTVVDSDLTVTAVVTLKTYTVTFKSGDSTIASMTAAHGVTLTAEQNAQGKLVFTQVDVPSGITAEKAEIPIVNEINGTKCYLYGYDTPTSAITGNTTVNLTYEEYDSVYEVMIKSPDETTYSLGRMNDNVSLPTVLNSSVSGYEDYDFVGWGAVTSGAGYANPSNKVGANSKDDDSGVKAITYYAGIDVFKGSVTLNEDINFGTSNREYANFMFVPVYTHKFTVKLIVNGTTYSDFTLYENDDVVSTLKKVNITFSRNAIVQYEIFVNNASESTSKYYSFDQNHAGKTIEIKYTVMDPGT